MPVPGSLQPMRESDLCHLSSFFIILVGKKSYLPYDPSIRIGHLIRKIDEEAIARLKEIGAQQICPCTDGLEQEDVRLAKSHGLEVRAWGAFTLELMRHALQCGVDGMTINFPDKLSEAIRR